MKKVFILLGALFFLNGCAESVALLGGSTTDPLGNKYSGKGTWEFHLFNKLANSSLNSFNVYNAGNAGANSSQELLRLIQIILH